MKYLLILIFTLLFLPISIYAKTPNNIYGIHLAQPHLDDLKATSDLVNSNGGKWGYVTLVLQENDRDKEKWQGIFDRMRELHLIPIIRLATQPEGENWRRPEPEDSKNWVEFLDSLNWVVKNRYIILFNEPNHAGEWGGEVDEKSFTEVSFAFAKALKKKNTDFFVMLAGLDASAPSWPPGIEDEEIFLRRMLKSEILNPKLETNSNDLNINNLKLENCFEFSASCFELLIDGWASHSYPNPDFAGSPRGFGRGTVRTYDWELGMLRRLGINKELPVFITETGWKRGSENIIANNFQIAFENVWLLDSRVQAVTPFIMDYQAAPFLEFSWKKFQSNEFYKQYHTVQSLSKNAGEPVQVEKGKIKFDLPKELVAQSKYDFNVTLNNLGQAIWDKDDGYELQVISDSGTKPANILIADIKDIKPFAEGNIDFSLKTDKPDEKANLKFNLMKNNQIVMTSDIWHFEVLPLPELTVEARFWPFGKAKGNDFEIQIFDTNDRLVFKKKGVGLENGTGMIKNIQNIAIDELYRVVILKPGYLPRQTFTVFKKGENTARFKSLLPFDLNQDGKLDFKDFLKIFNIS